MTEERKEHISVVVAGHIDAGKSSTVGHLLFKLGGISQREMQKLQAEADAQGKGSFAFAYYMDNQKEERERGVTISCNTKEFYTDNYHYTIVDAPGHRDYVKNMISGAGQADVGILLVPAEKGGFETAIAKGNHATGEVQGQTRQHARLLSLLGIEQLIIGVNKMDACNWSEERFNEIKAEMSLMLQQAGYKPKKVPFIPYSGYHGDNLIETTDKMPWFKGWEANLNPTTKVSGNTLKDALDKFVKPPKRDENGHLRLPISGVYNIKGVGIIIAGRVEQGTLVPGDEVGFMPSGVKGKIFSIEMHHKKYEKAVPGDNIGMSIKGLSKENLPKAGDVMFKIKDGNLEPVKKFRAQVAVQEHPGQLKAGFCPIVHVRTSKVACKMTSIVWKMGKKTGGAKEDGPQYIERGDSAEVEFEPTKPFFVEKFTDCPGLGRFAAMDSNSLVMLGKIL